MFSKLCRKEKFLFDFLLHFIGLVESFLEIGKKEKVRSIKNISIVFVQFSDCLWLSSLEMNIFKTNLAPDDLKSHQSRETSSVWGKNRSLKIDYLFQKKSFSNSSWNFEYIFSFNNIFTELLQSKIPCCGKSAKIAILEITGYLHVNNNNNNGDNTLRLLFYESWTCIFGKILC